MAQRPFNRDALNAYAVPWIRPNIGNWSTVWRYTVMVPMEQMLADGTSRPIATFDDVRSIELMLVGHFGGITQLPSVVGIGARDPKNPLETRETNYHTSFLVYAPACPASDQYFQALRAELQDALVEGIILVERQESLLL